MVGRPLSLAPARTAAPSSLKLPVELFFRAFTLGFGVVAVLINVPIIFLGILLEHNNSLALGGPKAKCSLHFHHLKRAFASASSCSLCEEPVNPFQICSVLRLPAAGSTQLCCQHMYCSTCIQKWAQAERSAGRPPTCPFCRRPFSGILSFSPFFDALLPLNFLVGVLVVLSVLSNISCALPQLNLPMTMWAEALSVFHRLLWLVVGVSGFFLARHVLPVLCSALLLLSVHFIRMVWTHLSPQRVYQRIAHAFDWAFLLHHDWETRRPPEREFNLPLYVLLGWAVLLQCVVMVGLAVGVLCLVSVTARSLGVLLAALLDAVPFLF